MRTVSSESLSYWPPPTEYEWNIDDIILLSYSARINGIFINISCYCYWPRPALRGQGVGTLLLSVCLSLLLGIGMYILNTEVFGYLLKTEEYPSLEHAIREIDNWKLKTIGTFILLSLIIIIFICIVNHYPVPVSQYISINSERERVGTDAVRKEREYEKIP